jgi:hypothetical protein
MTSPKLKILQAQTGRIIVSVGQEPNLGSSWRSLNSCRALDTIEVRIGGVGFLLWLLLGLLLFFVGGELFFIYLFRFWAFLVKSCISCLWNIIQLSMFYGETVSHRSRQQVFHSWNFDAMMTMANYYYSSFSKNMNINKVVTDNGAKVIVVETKGIGQHGDHSSTQDISLCMICLMRKV